MDAYELHDVRDLTAHVTDYLRSQEAFWSLADQEDCVSAMVEAVLKASTSWDAAKASFSTFARQVVSRRFVDYLRKHVHDSRNAERHKFDVVSIHELDGADHHGNESWSRLLVYEDEPDETPDESELLELVDLDSLTEEAQETLFRFAIPLRRGQDIEDLAELHGTTVRTITKRLTALVGECDAV